MENVVVEFDDPHNRTDWCLSPTDQANIEHQICPVFVYTNLLRIEKEREKKEKKNKKRNVSRKNIKYVFKMKLKSYKVNQTKH